jgi:hypothetical protein
MPPLATRGLRALALLCMAFACIAPASTRADEAADLEKRVKAAYILKFADYVDWPPAAFSRTDAPLTFGVLGDEQVAAELAQSIAGRSVGEHPLAVRRLKDGDTVAGLNIIFVAGKDSARLAQVVKSSGNQPLLIVTESDGSLEHGSAINFVLAGDRVKFEIALDGVDKRGLKLSSRLLAVARHVYSVAGSQ